MRMQLLSDLPRMLLSGGRWLPVFGNDIKAQLDRYFLRFGTFFQRWQKLSLAFCTNLWADGEALLFPPSWREDVERVFGDEEEFIGLVRDLTSEKIKEDGFKEFINTIRDLSFDLSGLSRLSADEERKRVEARFGRRSIVAQSEPAKAMEILLLSDLIDSVLGVAPNYSGSALPDWGETGAVCSSGCWSSISASSSQDLLEALWKRIGAL